MNDNIKYGIDFSDFYSFAGTDKYAYRIPDTGYLPPERHINHYRSLKKLYILDEVSRAISDEVQKKLGFNCYLSCQKVDLKLSEWSTRSQVQELFPPRCSRHSCSICYNNDSLNYNPTAGDYIGRIKHFNTKKKAEFRDKLFAFIEEEKKARERRKIIIKKLGFLGITMEESLNADCVAFFDLFEPVPRGVCECEHPGKTIIWHSYNCLKDENQAEHFKKEMLRIIKIAIKNRFAGQENAVIAAVSAYWDIVQANGLVNGKNQTDILGHDWKEYINALNTQDDINNYYDHLTGLIDTEEDLELQNFSFDINNLPDIDKKGIIKKLEEEVNRAIREIKYYFYKELLIQSFDFWKKAMMHSESKYQLGLQKKCLLSDIIKLKEWDNDFSNSGNNFSNSGNNTNKGDSNISSTNTNNISSTSNENSTPHTPSSSPSSSDISSSSSFSDSSFSPSSSSKEETTKPIKSKSLDSKENNTEPLSLPEQSQDFKEKAIQEIKTKLKDLPIDWKKLANSQYQNWEQEINQLTTIEQITAYQNALLQVIEQTKQQQTQKNASNSTATNQNKNKNIVLWIVFGGILVSGLVLVGYLAWKKKKK
ncbi:hypothetical protein [endosymbiont GvMRE of Glomus versiforme]|uniref:hypothetical protein n=1 Tax=endosymbiont GvMRE of Glomus versiforme TaxID=2039283 RepID=UPI000EC0E449|nr:hypothetical protein [endosymbiont GvMRE of Glomus versiforme]RHZ36771.1 hypothetical protein GvMRE_I2g153 [endosymbiont GvMRE of Glomus versiforme]